MTINFVAWCKNVSMPICCSTGNRPSAKGPLSPAFCLFLIIVLAASLRFIGLSWGIPSIDLPHRPFHPDEVWVIDNLKQIHPKIGDWNPETAHAEGTLSYFIWTAQALILNKLGIVSEMPGDLQAYNQDYADILYAGRVLIVCFDLLSLLFIYLILRRLCKNETAPLLGALVFALTPYEVIHAHFMRGHIIANFFEVLVIYFSVRIYETNRTLLYSAAGFFSGLAAATRYQTVAVLIIPVIVYLQNCNLTKDFCNLSFSTVLRTLGRCLNRKLLILALGFVVALFLGLPFLFLDFAAAKPHLQYLASYTAESEFSLGKLFDLSRVWTYIDYLIPYGTLPGLWILFYSSVIYLLFQRKLYKFSLPLIIFLAGYLYPMAKGYFAMPIFIRAAIPLFPPLAILSALAIDDFAFKLRSSLMKKVLVLALASILISTAFYDFAYVLGMHRPDPRIQISRYFTNEIQQSKLRIGLFPSGHSYFLIHPTLDILKNKQLTYVEKESFLNNDTAVDYIVLSAFEYQDYDLARQRIDLLVASKQYVLEKTFQTPLTFAGVTFAYPRNPHDLQYPFPTLYLLKHLAPD